MLCTNGWRPNGRCTLFAGLRPAARGLGDYREGAVPAGHSPLTPALETCIKLYGSCAQPRLFVRFIHLSRRRAAVVERA